MSTKSNGNDLKLWVAFVSTLNTKKCSTFTKILMSGNTNILFFSEKSFIIVNIQSIQCDLG